MLFKDVSMLDENMQLCGHMYVGTEKDTVTYVGNSMPENPEVFGEVYSKPNRLLLPGFFNAHSHLPMTLMRGYGENLSLMDWLTGRIFPFEAKLLPEDIYLSCLLNIAEMLRFGIVSSTDMYFSGDAMGRAFAESGVKANFSVSCVCSDNSSYFDLPVYKEALKIQKDFNGYDNGRIKTEFSLHAEYTSTERVTREIAKAAAENGSSIHVHVAETQNEVLECKARHNGKSPVRYFADCGVLDIHATAAHCIHITDEDIAILKEKNVNVATCPKSNLKLSSGICPASKLIAAGVNTAIGTDSVASNNNLNMLEEIKFFTLLQKVLTKNPSDITPSEAIYAATRAGAIAQGRKNDSGLIKTGYKADITVFDTDKIYMKPVHNILNNLIYSACGTDVCMTMVNGRVLYNEGEYRTLDIEKLEYMSEKSRLRILSQLSAK
ncbi:MAG: amidohydrolase [Lachnospiraceae bacterium]|nr:amidohydrolase [Lachnospiraceae bacterium]